MNNDKPINLLWTSGADSTFRLLELLLIQKRKVQPYYVIDRTRKSLNFELQRMEKIKELVFQKDPSTKSLLLPLKVHELADLNPNKTITEKYYRLAQIDHLGIQYEWLPRFAEDIGISDLEISLTSGEHSDSYFKRFLKPHLIKYPDDKYHNYKLKENPPNEDLTIFKYFRYPIIELSKIQMREIARKNNFDDIMKFTWFCHAPINNKPCGVCNPCKIAIKEGMWRRIPVSGLIRNFALYKIRPLIKGKMEPVKKPVLAQ